MGVRASKNHAGQQVWKFNVINIFSYSGYFFSPVHRRNSASNYLSHNFLTCVQDFPFETILLLMVFSFFPHGADPLRGRGGLQALGGVREADSRAILRPKVDGLTPDSA